MPDPMKIVVDVVNSEKVKALTAEIEKQQSAIRVWNQLEREHNVSSAAATQHQFAAATAINRANAALKEIPTTATSAGSGLGQLAYAIDDLQYGFNAIVNNIPQIVLGLGGGVGLAGAIGIAAVAVNQLIKHWGELTDAFQQAWSGAQVSQLEQVRQRAEEAATAYDKLRKAKTEWEEKGAAAASKLIANTPPEQLERSLTRAIEKAGEGAPLDLETAKRQLQVAPDIEPDAGEVLKLAKEKQREANKKIAQDIMGGLASADPQAIERAKHLVEKMPGEFPEEFTKKLLETTPEDIKRQEEAQKAGDKLRKSDEAADKAKEADAVRMHKEVQERVEVAKGERELVKKRRIETLEDQKNALQETRQRIQKEISQTPHQAAQFGSTQDYLKSLSGMNMDKVPKEQLKKLEDIDKGIKDVEKAIKDERRAAKFG